MLLHNPNQAMNNGLSLNSLTTCQKPGLPGANWGKKACDIIWVDYTREKKSAE